MVKVKKWFCSSGEFCMYAVMHHNVYFLRKIHQNTVFAVVRLCRKIWKINLFLWKYTKTCHQSCSFWPRYAPNRLSTGASSQSPLGGGSSQRSSRPSSWCRGWAPGEGVREGEGKGEGQERRGREGEERMRGEAGHPRFSYGLTPLAPWLLVVDKGM